MFLHPPRSLAGLAVRVHGAVLALDQWDKLLESGQLWQIAQKEKSLPLQKIGFCHHVLYLYRSTSTKKKKRKWGELEGMFFLFFPLKPPKDLSFHASFVCRVTGRGWGWGGGGGGVCRGLWEERGGRRTSAGCRWTSCQTWVLTRKLNKAATHPAANDGCYSLTTRLVVMMADKPGAQEYSASPTREGFTART